MNLKDLKNVQQHAINMSLKLEIAPNIDIPRALSMLLIAYMCHWPDGLLKLNDYML